MSYESLSVTNNTYWNIGRKSHICQVACVELRRQRETAGCKRQNGEAEWQNEREGASLL